MRITSLKKNCIKVLQNRILPELKKYWETILGRFKPPPLAGLVNRDEYPVINGQVFISAFPKNILDLRYNLSYHSIMKKLFILILTNLFFIGNYNYARDVYLIKTDSCGNEIWSKTYGEEDFEIGRCIQQTKDGGYIIVGETYSHMPGLNDADVFLIKTDAFGNEIWIRSFGDSEYDSGESVRQTTDGGYIIVGITNSTGNSDVYLIKTDSYGNEIWSKTYGGNYYERGNSVYQTEDGGYIIIGETNSSGFGYDVYLIKTDSLGNEMWSKTYRKSIGSCRGMFGQQTDDGGYIIVGTVESGISNIDIYLIKIDSEGNEIWNKTHRGRNGLSVQQTNDGGYIIVGEVIHDLSDVLLLKTDETGDYTWSRSFGGERNDIGYSVQQTTDGGYIIVGEARSFDDEILKVYLIKTDENGNEVWSKTFSGIYGASGYSVQQTTDGGYIIVGEIFLINSD